MGILDTIFGKSAPVTLELKKAYDAGRVGIAGIPTYPDSDRVSLMNWQRRNELVYACIRKKCEAASDPELVVERKNGKGEWETIEGHPFAALIERPNPFDTFDTFLTAWVGSEETTGDFYAEIVRDRGGVPVQLHPLIPSQVFPIPDSKGGILKYEFRAGDGTVVNLNPEDVLHRRKTDLTSRYYGLSPVKVALGSIDADQSQTDFTRAFFHGDGVPSGLLTTDTSLGEEQAKALQQRWQKNFSRGGVTYKQTAVLGQGVTYQQIGSGIGDIESHITRGQSESRICMVFGVPPALVGAYVGLDLATNNATMRTHMEDFWLNTMSPMLKQMRVWMTWNILTEFESLDAIKAKKIRVNWDMTQVMAMQEDEDKRHDRARANFSAGGWSINEFREATGLEPIEGEDYYLQPKSLDPVAEVIRQLLAVREPPEPPDPNEMDTVDGEVVEPKQIEAGKLSIPFRYEGKFPIAPLKKKTFDYEGLTLSREPNEVEKRCDLKGMVEAYDGRRDKINRVLVGIRNDLITQAVEAVKELSAGDVYTLALQPPTTAYKRLKKEIEAAYEDGRRQVANELGGDAKDKRDKGFLARLVEVLISRMVGEMAARAINAVTQYITLGLTGDEITARLKDELDAQSLKVFESYAAQTANAAINAGRDAEAEERQDEWNKVEYSAILDASTCEICESADGMTSDDVTDLPEAPNPDCEGGAKCRCFHIYHFTEGNA